jgi:acetyl esterase
MLLLHMLKKIAIAAILFSVASLAAWHTSPWPSALFYRYLFDKGGIAMNETLAPHVPDGVTTQTDISYGALPIEKLDIHFPPGIQGSDRILPTLVWIHGGGFLSGDKNQVSNYLKIIAHAGYVVVGVNYTLSPESRHPIPVRQANAALAFLTANSAKLNLDPARIFLAGDSAGSQIAAQLGIAIAEPDFAKSLDLVPAIPLSALRGLVLHCGIYDPKLLNAEGAMAGFLKTVAWSYFGTKDINGTAVPAQFSIVRNITNNLPPLFITAGNADPLLPHSLALAQAAARANVAVDSLFFPNNYKPPLQHEYEFNLDTAAGKLALQRSLTFVDKHAR